MSELENKKFKVEHTARFLASLISSWRNFYKSWDDLRTEMQKLNRRERTPLLAGCAGIVTILLGLASTGNISTTDLYFYLAIDVGVAVFIFLGYGLYNFSVTRSLEKSEIGLIESINNLEGFENHFLWMTYNLDKITIEKIDDFFGFVILIEGSNKVRMYKEFHKISKMKRLLGIRQEIERVISQWIVGIDESVKAIESVKDELEKEEWKAYLPFIQDLLDYKKEKLES